jgi:hypothetical protein
MALARADRFGIRHCIIHVSRVHPYRHTAPSNHERAECSFKGAILLHSHARRSFRNHSHCPSIDGVLYHMHCIISRANTAPVVVWLGYTTPVRALLPRHFDICCPSTKQIHHEIAIFGTRADRFGTGTAPFTFRAFQHPAPSNHERAECSFKGVILLHSHARRLFRITKPGSGKMM